jgi:hypothetical protein
MLLNNNDVEKKGYIEHLINGLFFELLFFAI